MICLDGLIMQKEVDVLLIHPPFHRRKGSSLAPPMGLAYVASSLREKGYTVYLIDSSLLCDSLKEGKKRSPSNSPAIKDRYIRSATFRACS